MFVCPDCSPNISYHWSFKHKHPSKRAIATANKAKMTGPPFRPPTSPSVITSPQRKPTGPRHSPHVKRPDAAEGRGEARVPQLLARRASPLLRARRRTLPGGSAYLAAVPTPRRRPRRRRRGGRVAGGARAITGRGRGAAPGCTHFSSPHQRPPDAIATLLARVGPRASWPRALSAAASEPKGQISFHNKVSWSPQPHWRPKPAGRPGQGRERGRRGPRWEGSARGEGGRRPGPAAGLTRVTTSATRGRGTGSSKTKPKMGNGEAEARGVLCWCLGPKLLWLPEIRASGSFFLSFLLKCACASWSRAALGAALSAQRRGGRYWRGEPSFQHPGSSQYPLPLQPPSPQPPHWAPTTLARNLESGRAAHSPRGDSDAGVTRTPGPSRCFH